MMKRILVAALALGAFQMSAQDLPMPSPPSTLEQRVGLTDITINYSRPGAKDRQVFGDLVPFGEIWRTGANKVPNIEFTTDVNINGENIEAGKYALLTIPQEGEWTIILNKDTEMWGTGNSDDSKDVLRVQAEAEESDFTETFTIGINDIRNESASLIFRWAETKVVLPFKVRVKEQALANIEKAIKESDEEKQWQVYRNAANYYYDNKMDLKTALDYVDKSIAAHDQSWYSYWLKAEILAEQGKYKDAINAAKRAKEVGREDAVTRGNEFTYEETIDAGIATWKTKQKGS